MALQRVAINLFVRLNSYVSCRGKSWINQGQLVQCPQAAGLRKSKETMGLMVRSDENLPRTTVALRLVLEKNPFYQGLCRIAIELNFWII